MKTKSVNLRGFPDSLLRRAKSRAALEGIALKTLVIKAIERYIEEKDES